MSNPDVRPTILLVEDDERTRSSLQTYLQQADYQVLTARDGCEALSLTRQNCPDLVITDIYLPQMDGLELTRHLRSTCLATKILIFSKGSGAYYPKVSGASYLKVAQLLGAHAALPEPLSFAMLLETVEQLVRSK